MRLDVVTIFPGMFDAVRYWGMTRRALESGSLELALWDPREFTEDSYRRVDDRPYGGGPGMVMMIEPLRRALTSARAAGGGKVLHLSPQGGKLDQARIKALANQDSLVLLSGRYEGIDERLIETEVDDEISIGDYVVAGGELPAMVLIEALVRQLPGVLGNDGSAAADSFSDGLLDWPHYTRPEVYRGGNVPPVLLSGNHDEIRRWRLKQALGRTWMRRPDLLAKRKLNKEEHQLLEQYKREREERES
ncbi:MAG: tRNA (guanosine(37)-N1)-methyltransferase TrmD [Candidatus Thioglobus sp. MED-G25]|jgi:tRNA (guanine37-N1)-methyltransferase|nr:MAG: tRNA (guanosine(37)-N1)-methyltransferase TrmD [Candidatus Thioglobus sp. MED-G25]